MSKLIFSKKGLNIALYTGGYNVESPLMQIEIAKDKESQIIHLAKREWYELTKILLLNILGESD